MPTPHRYGSSELAIVPIPYLADAEPYFLAIRHLPNPVWMDSGFGTEFLGADGRYDILAAQPLTTLITRGDNTEVIGPDRAITSTENPFDLLGSALAELPEIENRSLPFTGGAIGYFGYHLNRRLERLPEGPSLDIGLPDMQIGIYHWAIILDHKDQQAFALFLPTVPLKQQEAIQRLLEAATNTASIDIENTLIIKEIISECNVNYYQRAIRRIQDYILAGDVYQVNLAQRFKAAYQGNPSQGYIHLRKVLPAPYSAYLGLDAGAVLSFSPELFLAVDGNQVVTKPIKGTRPRGSTSEEDAALSQQLENSGKDQAENLMIVDLLRNDLGKHCQPGSIHVPELFKLKTFKNVHHLESTVVGQLRESSSPIDLLRDSFPGGSITGAPKIRAMEIIAELEQQERSVYCGSIGFLSTNGRMTSNIAIRTLVVNQSHIYAWGGGGIVADSKANAEYQECLDKIGILLNALADS